MGLGCGDNSRRSIQLVVETRHPSPSHLLRPVFYSSGCASEPNAKPQLHQVEEAECRLASIGRGYFKVQVMLEHTVKT